MAWNEPGGNNQDPWGGKRKNDGPPDLDEALKSFQKKVNGIFGNKNGGGSGSDNGGFSGPSIMVALLVGVIGYFALGIYQLDAKERAVILRLGEFHSIQEPGLHWNPPLIDQRFTVNVTEERQYRAGGLMLTEDESIVEVPVTVQYNIADVKEFILNVKDPEISLQHATDSALRHVVGSTELNQVLSEGRGKIAAEMLQRVQDYLNSYGAGIKIVGVNIQEGRPPTAVKDAFDDVVKAKENQEELKNQAQAYANGIVPEARGQAQRTIEEASAYRDQVIAKAEGEAERFNKLLTEYRKAPQVTRERLYLDAIEVVMESSSKVLIDVEGGNNMMYLPLDKITNQSESAIRSGSRLSNAEINDISQQVLDRLNSRTTTRSSRGAR